jgi:NADP-dependent 3-hydroxy acid dehydrogenase YdfG
MTGIEPLIQATNVARAVVYMTGLPLDTNLATITVLPSKMPYVGSA